MSETITLNLDSCNDVLKFKKIVNQFKIYRCICSYTLKLKVSLI